MQGELHPTSSRSGILVRYFNIPVYLSQAISDIRSLYFVCNVALGLDIAKPPPRPYIRLKRYTTSSAINPFYLLAVYPASELLFANGQHACLDQEIPSFLLVCLSCIWKDAMPYHNPILQDLTSSRRGSVFPSTPCIYLSGFSEIRVKILNISVGSNCNLISVLGLTKFVPLSLNADSLFIVPPNRSGRIFDIEPKI